MTGSLETDPRNRESSIEWLDKRYQSNNKRLGEKAFRSSTTRELIFSPQALEELKQICQSHGYFEKPPSKEKGWQRLVFLGKRFINNGILKTEVEEIRTDLAGLLIDMKTDAGILSFNTRLLCCELRSILSNKPSLLEPVCFLRVCPPAGITGQQATLREGEKVIAEFFSSYPGVYLASLSRPKDVARPQDGGMAKLTTFYVNPEGERHPGVQYLFPI